MASLLGDLFGAPQPSMKPYDPNELARMKRQNMLLGAGIGLLGQGASRTPITWGQQLGNAFQGAAIGRQTAYDDWLDQSQAYDQMAAREAEAAQRQAQQQAIDDLLPTLPADVQGFARAFPDKFAELYMESHKPQKADPFTLGEGQVRYDANGQQIAAGPAKTVQPTDDMREYEMAVKQGYKGSFQQYMLEMRKAGSTQVNVNGDQKLTEGQSKDINFYARGKYANQELEQTEDALLSLGDQMAGKAGMIGNYLVDPKFQQAQRAGREVLAVLLRKDTGAAVTPQEFELYGPMYLPWPGDETQTIAAKREARARAIAAIKLGGGTARPLFDQVDKEFETVQPPKHQGGASGTTSTGIPWSVK